MNLNVFHVTAPAFVAIGMCLAGLTGCDSQAYRIPAVVEGDSMAPCLPGKCLEVTCPECEYEYRVEHIAIMEQLLTCPNCCNRDLKVANAKTVEPAEIELRNFVRFPRRWDVVGFDLPADSDSQRGIKRIVGLPGETITIRDGDLYTDRGILRKPWKLQKELRIPVFDSEFAAIEPFGNASRFRSSQRSGWKVRDRYIRFMAAEQGRTQWLEYVHWKNYKHQGMRATESAIEDSYGFNQTADRNLFRVHDLMLQLDLDFENDSVLELAFRRGRSEFLFAIRKKETRIELQFSGATSRKPLVYQSVIEAELPATKIEFSGFDQSLQLRVNGQAMFQLREDESIELPSETSVFAATYEQPFQIGGSEGAFQINRLRIWRDIHYLPAPAGFDAGKEVKLTAGPNEYILMGDNSPRSLDSRSWRNPGISRGNLIGKLVSQPSIE